MAERSDAVPPRVLALVYDANPRLRSAALIGWSLTEALARRAALHVVTPAVNREPFLAAGWREGDNLTVIEVGPVEAAMRRLTPLLVRDPNRGLSAQVAIGLPAYYEFEGAAWRRFRPALAARRFDLVHRVTPVSPAMPSLIAARVRRLGMPFVVGPLNGGLKWPAAFDAVRRREGEWLSYVRDLHKLLPGWRGLRRAASAILVGARDMMDQMPAAARERCVFMPENGIDPTRFAPQPRAAPGLPLRVLFLGRLVPFKGADMLIEAARDALLAGRLTLDVVGDGFDRPRLEALAAELGLADRVRFRGDVDHTRIQRHLAEADLLGLPSIREFGGGVVIEAMYMGVVPLVVDYGGPPEHVTPASGFTVPMGPRAAIVAGVRRVLEDCLADPARLAPMAAAAQRRAAALYTWDARAGQIAAVYDWVLGRRPDRPDFGMPFRDP